MLKSYGQDSLTVKSDCLRTQVFSLSPISKKVDKVNGLVLGIGHFENKHVQIQTINGVNIEANPAPIAGALIGFMALIYSIPDGTHNKKPDSIKKPIELKIDFSKNPLKLKLRGLNISSGCFFTDTNIEGLNISFGNKFNNFNGLSIAPLGTIADNQNGISIGFINANNRLNGLIIGIYNQSLNLNGLQLGVYNLTENNKGIQIGFYNRTFKKGLQIGFWNKNNKRAMPFINW
jgi:hypothetical protein